MNPVAALSVGDGAVASLALILGVYEAWLFYGNRQRTEHLWVAAICFSTMGYATAMVFHYNADAPVALIMSRMEASMMVVLACALPMFAESFTGRRMPVPRWLVPALFVAWFALAWSPWLIPYVEPFELTLLHHSFWRRPQTLLLTVSLVIGLLMFTASAVWLIKHRAQRPWESRYFVVGLCIWAMPVIYMFVTGVLQQPYAASLAEYGFVGFALALVTKDATLYMRLLTDSEQQSRTVSDNFARLIELSPDLVAISRGKTFVYVNPALKSLLGYAPEELTGREVASVFDRDLASYADQSEIPGLPVEARLQTKSGDATTVELRCLHMIFDGAPALVVLGRDISERQRLTRQMMELDRIAAVGTLAAGVGHEINNPLSYVLLNLDESCTLVERVSTGEASKDDLVTLRELVEESAQGANRIKDIVGELRSFSRVSDEATTLGIDDVVASAVKLATNSIRHKADIVINYQPSPMVQASKGRLGQVVLNLLVNAAQAIPEGSEQRHKVFVDTGTDNGWAMVSVRDTGVGISADNLERIFDPFFTTKSVGQGTGLGLSICRENIRNMGGRIEAHSELGKGTTIRVLLPPADQATAPAPQVESTSSDGRPRVLIIDDEPLILMALRRALSGSFEAVTCENGPAALALLESEPVFAAVVADLMMPKMSGMQLYEQIAEQHPELEPRMLFMSGGAVSTAASEFCLRFRDRLLAKPLDLEELRRKVAAVTSNV